MSFIVMGTTGFNEGGSSIVYLRRVDVWTIDWLIRTEVSFTCIFIRQLSIYTYQNMDVLSNFQVIYFRLK